MQNIQHREHESSLIFQIIKLSSICEYVKCWFVYNNAFHRGAYVELIQGHWDNDELSDSSRKLSSFVWRQDDF